MSQATSIRILTYDNQLHRDALIALWEKVFSYDTPHNDPRLSIDKKLEVDTDLLFVAIDAEEQICGSVMAGYDGHRGWIYSLAVDPELGRKGVGGKLLDHAESALAAKGCFKVNLQVIDGNLAAIKFYHKRGYLMEPRTSFGKVLKQNLPD